MIALNTIAKTQLEKALARAEAEKIDVIHTDISGVYFVRSGENLYMVIIAKEDGVVKSDCSCPAGMHDKMCKHQALCLKAHKEKLAATFLAEVAMLLADAAVEAPEEVKTNLFPCLGRNCPNKVDERDALCPDCQSEVAIARDELFG
jgi:hypothetical protein